MTLAAAEKFSKLIYNDADGDLVNLFRVISDPAKRADLYKILRWLPPSRRIFEEDYQRYRADGFSFCRVQDPVQRARMTLYRHAFAFGGKVRSGGFAVSTGDDQRIKEVNRYRNILRKVARIGNLFRGVLIENQHYADLIEQHGRSDAVLFVDPPYHGTEDCYSRSFGSGDHTFLAQQLASTRAQVVCTYYDTPLIRSLYPEPKWRWESICATKNSCFLKGNKAVTTEHCIIKATQP